MVVSLGERHEEISSQQHLTKRLTLYATDDDASSLQDVHYCYQNLPVAPQVARIMVQPSVPDVVGFKAHGAMFMKGQVLVCEHLYSCTVVAADQWENRTWGNDLVRGVLQASLAVPSSDRDDGTGDLDLGSPNVDKRGDGTYGVSFTLAREAVARAASKAGPAWARDVMVQLSIFNSESKEEISGSPFELRVCPSAGGFGADSSLEIEPLHNSKLTHSSPRRPRRRRLCSRRTGRRERDPPLLRRSRQSDTSLPSSSRNRSARALPELTVRVLVRSSLRSHHARARRWLWWQRKGTNCRAKHAKVKAVAAVLRGGSIGPRTRQVANRPSSSTRGCNARRDDLDFCLCRLSGPVLKACRRGEDMLGSVTATRTSASSSEREGGRD